MLQQLSYNEFCDLAKNNKRIAVFKEIAADRLTPIAIAEALDEEMRAGVILESGLQQQDTGRYSFIACHPEAQFRVENQQIFQTIAGHQQMMQGSPFDILRQMMTRLTCITSPQMTPFIGGPVGLISYDAVRYFENIPDRHHQHSLPDILFNFYRTTLLFDHSEQKLLISTIVEVNQDCQTAYQEAQDIMADLLKKMTVHLGEIQKNKKDLQTERI